ncbi:protein CrcB [Ureibacillus xyleni]|uniref:Fluoride-specific ion channel FluC n=1 Tax=Ureibacillus xyleni TaxID=614648 RepID=A0A285SBX3_9BACL|nr:fluoride efflux transporter CrcB [Ureibacillus xyleni]SOC05194.1 protein CrcB [Ureibacillus xyleni]
MSWLLVALGGGLGAALRYTVQVLITKVSMPSYWSTILVNLIGSFFIGFIASWEVNNQLVFSLLTIGLLGGFTTFSTFSYDVVKLVDQKQIWKSFVYVIVNILGGLLFFWIGWRF